MSEAELERRKRNKTKVYYPNVQSNVTLELPENGNTGDLVSEIPY